MNEIKTVLFAIGDRITAFTWYQMVKWPFWILLFTVAAAGVYTARFGKKTLLCRAVSGTLNLCGIYQAAFLLYTFVDDLRTLPFTLPFLTVTADSVALMDVMSMDLFTLAPMLLRLMILQLLVDFVEHLNPGGKTFFPGWIFSQFMTVLISLLAYLVGTAGFTLLLPCISGKYALIPVCLAAGIFVVMLCGKLIFTVVLESGDPNFKKCYDFFTTDKIGSLLTVSALSFVITATVFTVLYATGNSSLTFATANRLGSAIILLMLIFSEFIFAMYFCGKKK